MEKCLRYWIGKINIVKMSTLPKLIYRSDTIHIEYHVIFHRLRKNNTRIHL